MNFGFVTNRFTGQTRARTAVLFVLTLVSSQAFAIDGKSPQLLDQVGLGAYPAMSGDGRFVAFTGELFLDDVYLHDTCIGGPKGCVPQTQLISQAFDGGDANEDSDYPALSGDGRYIVFESFADNLDPDDPAADLSPDGDPDKKGDVFLHDTCFGAPGGCVPGTMLVSVAHDGGVATRSSGCFKCRLSRRPKISADGRYIAFLSTANNLVTPELVGPNDAAYVRDTCIGAPGGCVPSTGLIALNIFGNLVAISPDGGYVVFVSYGPTQNLLDQGLYLYDRMAQDFTYLSDDINGNAYGGGVGVFAQATISAGGRYVAFEASDGEGFYDPLVTGDDDGIPDVFIADTCIGAVEECNPALSLIPKAGAGNQVYQSSPRMTPDGRHVIFWSSDDLGPSVYVHDTCTGVAGNCVPESDVVSVDASGDRFLDLGGLDGGPPAISDDGGLAVFSTYLYACNDAFGPALTLARTGAPSALDTGIDAVAGLPDIDGNGFADIAVLVESTSHHVHVRDGDTGALISDINFGNDPVVGMAVIDDVSGNGKPEIALVGARPNTNVRVQVKDSDSGSTVNNIFYGTGFRPLGLDVLPDTNANDADELAVLGIDCNRGVRVQARDALSDAETSTTFFGSSAPPQDVVSMPDVSGNGEPEMIMHGQVRSSGQARAQLRDTDTRALLRNIYFGTAYTPLQLAPIGDVSGDGVADLAQLGKRDDTGAVRIQMKRTDTGATVSNAFTGSGSEPIAIVGIGDANGNSAPDVALLVQEANGTAKIIVRDGATGAFIRNIFAGAVSNPVAIGIVPDLDTSGDPELAVLGDDGAGTKRVQIKDSISGAQINTIDFP